MSLHDDAAVAALYGKSYGRAHHDQAQGDESLRSAEDTTRRAKANDDLSASVGFRSALNVFGTSDEAIGIRAGVAGLTHADIAREEPAEHEAEEPADEPAADDPVGAELSDGWHDTVSAFAASHSDFTTDAVLVEAFGMVPEHIERADQMRIAEILRELGFTSQQRRVKGGERQNLWAKRP